MDGNLEVEMTNEYQLQESSGDAVLIHTHNELLLTRLIKLT